MSEYKYTRRYGHDWDEHNVIQPLLVLFLRGGIAPANEVILHKNCVDRGLMKLDLFGNTEFTQHGKKILNQYLATMRRHTFYD